MYIKLLFAPKPASAIEREISAAVWTLHLTPLGRPLKLGTDLGTNDQTGSNRLGIWSHFEPGISPILVILFIIISHFQFNLQIIG